MKKLLTIPIIMGLTLAVALIGVTWLLAQPARAHAVQYDYRHDCGTYTLKINLTADVNDPQDHRIIVTENDTVITKRDIVGVDADFADFLTVGGTLGSPVVYRTYVFDRVNGGFVYNPAINDFFRSGVSNGDNGQASSTPFSITDKDTCTPTPVPTATATQVPPTPTQTAADRCIAAGGVWTATGCEAVQPTPTATVAPPPATLAPSVGVITPPSTGDAGLLP